MSFAETKTKAKGKAEIKTKGESEVKATVAAIKGASETIIGV